MDTEKSGRSRKHDTLFPPLPFFGLRLFPYGFFRRYQDMLPLFRTGSCRLCTISRICRNFSRRCLPDLSCSGGICKLLFRLIRF